MFFIYNYFKFKIYNFYKKYNWIIFFFTYKKLLNLEYYNYKKEKINLNNPIYNFKSLEDKSFNKNCLFVSSGDCNLIPLEILNIKAFEYCGYKSHILIPRDKKLKKTFFNFGIKNLIFWDEFPAKYNYLKLFDIFSRLKNFDDVKKLNQNGINYGKYVHSTLLRKNNRLNFDLSNFKDKNLTIFSIYKSLIFQGSIKKIFTKIKPDILYLSETTYTPVGDLFDYAIDQNIKVVAFHLAHKNNSTVYKKYSKNNRSEHPYGLSQETWHKVKSIKWNNHLKIAVDEEILQSYKSNQWYSSQASAVKTQLYDTNKLKKKLSITDNKKVAIIYPNIFWDATYFWGKHLFKDYQDWFLETVKEACKNNNVQWFIKIHPSNIVKLGKNKDFSEVKVIRKYLDKLPNNIKFIYPNDGISTNSLFSISDFCVTVSGTVGIEASIQGVTTITGGNFRYDNLGFTIDSQTKEEYLNKLSNIEKLSPINDEQIEIAYRYAYATFIQKSIESKLINYEFSKDFSLRQKNYFLFNHDYNLNESSFFKKFSEWLYGNNPDFINL